MTFLSKIVVFMLNKLNSYYVNGYYYIFAPGITYYLLKLIIMIQRCFQVSTPKKYYYVTFSEFRRLSVFNSYKHLCRTFWFDTFYYFIRIPSASLIDHSEILM